MIPLSAEQLDAARLLVRAVGDIPLGLVGAAALGFHLPLRTKTEDVDFVVATTPETTARLLEAPGWKRHPRREHEWTAPNGARVDVVPASDAALRLGFLDWPESGNRMSLVGLRLVFEHAQRASLGHGLTLRVPYVPVIALLKMVAYRDRHDRTAKDLQHLADILDGYPPTTTIACSRTRRPWPGSRPRKRAPRCSPESSRRWSTMPSGPSAESSFECSGLRRMAPA